MYKIKLIDDMDLYRLLELHYKLQQLLPAKLSKSESAWVLLNYFSAINFIALGLYKDDSLVGFITGNEATKEIYYFSNLYIEPGHRLGIKKLMKNAEDRVIKMGYKAWYSDSVLKEGKKVLLKFGAKEI
jgi:hypothetical protein